MDSLKALLRWSAVTVIAVHFLLLQADHYDETQKELVGSLAFLTLIVFLGSSLYFDSWYTEITVYVVCVLGVSMIVILTALFRQAPHTVSTRFFVSDPTHYSAQEEILAKTLADADWTTPKRESSALQDTSAVELGSMKGGAGETGETYWDYQPLMLNSVGGLMVIFVIFWYRQSRWGRRLAPSKRHPYKPLDVEKNEIRLLKILPHTEKDEIVSCKIRHAPFAENPAYVALSYNWGDQNERRSIVLNGVTVSVTASLEEALRHMRPRWKSLEVWIDALCIDQQNKDERGAQVLRMFGIYQRARVVAVWLGAEAEGSEKIMNVLSKSQGLERPMDYGDRFLRPFVAYEQPPSSEEWLSFFMRPYWLRVWIIQEIVAARQVCLLCGDWTVELKNVNTLLSALTMALPQGAEKIIELIKFIFESSSAHRDLDQKPIRFLEALHQTRYSMSSEILDKVYGIIGLASDGSTFVTEPSYGISKRQLCMIMTEGAISRKGSLDFIFLGNKASDMPTWCPDYTANASESLDPIMIRYLLGQDVRHRAGVRLSRWNTTGTSRVSSMTALIDHAEGAIRFKALSVGIVTNTSNSDSPFSSPSDVGTLGRLDRNARDDIILKCLLQILFIYEGNSETKDRLFQVCSYILTYLLDFPVVHEWYVKHARFEVHGISLFSRLEANPPEGWDYDEWESHEREDMVTRCAHALESVIKEQLSLITLEAPDVGWAHPDTKTGDQVFVAHGCSIPIVLRPVIGVSNRFTLVGRAYVSTAMNNEYEDELKQSAQWIEVF